MIRVDSSKRKKNKKLTQTNVQLNTCDPTNIFVYLNIQIYLLDSVICEISSVWEDIFLVCLLSCFPSANIWLFESKQKILCRQISRCQKGFPNNFYPPVAYNTISKQYQKNIKKTSKQYQNNTLKKISQSSYQHIDNYTIIWGIFQELLN